MKGQLPTSKRAGSTLDMRFARRIYGVFRGRRVFAGTLDPTQALFQTGGKAAHFILWAERRVSLGAEVWDQIGTTVDRLEFIDHDANLCYVTGADHAACGTFYDRGGGRRLGIPLDCFRVLRADGTVKTARACGGRVPPVKHASVAGTLRPASA